MEIDVIKCEPVNGVSLYPMIRRGRKTMCSILVENVGNGKRDMDVLPLIRPLDPIAWDIWMQNHA